MTEQVSVVKIMIVHSFIQKKSVIITWKKAFVGKKNAEKDTQNHAGIIKEAIVKEEEAAGTSMQILLMKNYLIISVIAVKPFLNEDTFVSFAEKAFVKTAQQRMLT